MADMIVILGRGAFIERTPSTRPDNRVVTNVNEIKGVFHESKIIFQTHNQEEPLTPVSWWDITCIAQAGFRKYCRCCHREDAGIQKESRLSQ